MVQAECGLPGRNDAWDSSKPPRTYFNDGCSSFVARPELVAPTLIIFPMPPFNNVYAAKEEMVVINFNRDLK